MNSKIYALVCLFAILSGVYPALAQLSEEKLSLKQALTIAYQQNPQIIQAKKAIKAAQGDLITVKSWPDPQFEVEISGLKSGGEESHVEEISFKQPFDQMGVRSLKKKIGKNEITIKEYTLKDVWSELYVNVRRTYSRIILNQKELELKRNNLNFMRQFFSDVQLRFNSGQALKNHVQRAKIELLKAESDYLKTENDLKIDKSRLNLLMGRKREVSFDVKEELSEELLRSELNTLIDLAMQKRPDLKMEEIQLDTLRKIRSKEKRSRYPSYALGLKRTDEDAVEDYAAVIEFSVPLWDFKRGAIKKLEAQQDAQHVLLKAKKEEVAFEVYAAYQEAQLAIKQLQLYKQSLLEANEMFRLAVLRYDEGQIDFLNYLDQLQTSMNSRMQYYKGLYQLSQNITKLERAIYSSLRKEEYLP